MSDAKGAKEKPPLLDREGNPIPPSSGKPADEKPPSGDKPERPPLIDREGNPIPPSDGKPEAPPRDPDRPPLPINTERFQDDEPDDDDDIDVSGPGRPGRPDGPFGGPESLPTQQARGGHGGPQSGPTDPMDDEFTSMPRPGGDRFGNVEIQDVTAQPEGDPHGFAEIVFTVHDGPDGPDGPDIAAGAVDAPPVLASTSLDEHLDVIGSPEPDQLGNFEIQDVMAEPEPDELGNFEIQD